MGSSEVNPRRAPVGEAERNTSLDVLRGSALLGILVINIQAFAMPPLKFLNPSLSGLMDGVDFWIWLVSHTLANHKFITIFSMLFGAGIVLMTERAEQRGASSIGPHYRRMLWLMVIGLAHAYLVWAGDILFIYGSLGLVAYWFRNRRPWTLVAMAFPMIAVPSLILWQLGRTMPSWTEQEQRELEVQIWDPGAEALTAELEAYRGSWLDGMPYRAGTATVRFTTAFVLEYFWRVLGLMLVGMALYRWGFLTGVRARRDYVALVGVGALVGVPVVLLGVARNIASDWEFAYSFPFGSQYNYWGSILVAGGWIGAVMLLCNSGRAQRVARALAAVGRTALSNYLLQTALCTFVFYGFGLGLYGRFDRVEQVALLGLVWAIQLVVSTWWLGRFRFGPFEWLWRSLTYWRLQPIARS